MKPKISTTEFAKMEAVLKARNSTYARYLRNLIDNFKHVSDADLGKKIVRLNSVVELWHEVLEKKVKFQVVLPDDANVKKRKLSVFAPVCLAILGRTEGDLVQTNRAGIDKKYRILNVQN